ncbi:hypothetical protein HMPREF0293_0041 [Corynebacterium glucuronolyticum ATCC 51866]|uniref:Uncharacterized protein n=1 Tax=Corynebacterium glucuronolyticum ATCC 51866 TaxID=548478 RepID=A0ABP2DWQ8_9CORY|nr:hypothetical protein HMPREF0293_0041 [Corynebacterium glucuronolyticum ATCC 51866]
MQQTSPGTPQGWCSSNQRRGVNNPPEMFPYPAPYRHHKTSAPRNGGYTTPEITRIA